MTKYETLLLALEGAEIGQSTIIALFLVFLHFRNRKKSMLLLALFFLFYSLASILEVSLFFKYISNSLFILPSVLHFVAYSFFYAHVNSLLINRNNKRKIRIFVIGIGASILGVLISLYSFFIKDITNHYITYSYEVMALIFLLYVSVLLIISIKKHNNFVKNQYSDIENRKLQFVFYWIIMFVLYLVIFLFVQIDFYLLRLLETMISLIWTLGLAYNALLYQMSDNLFDAKQFTSNNNSINKDANTVENNSKNKQVSVAKKDEYSDLMKKIKYEIESNKMFLNSELTISDLAISVNEHPKLVSQIINTNTNQNFNNYINQFRVMYAKEMLVKPENKHLNIEGIGNLSGFKSNSTFYSAFRKHLNCTPLQFMKKHKK